MAGEAWTTGDIEQLRRHARHGAVHVAALLGRSVKSVRQAAHRYRISLRRPGERRGLMLGQPAGQSWEELRAAGVNVAVLRAIRAEALAGTIDAGELERRAAQIRRDLDLPLCPSCLQRPARMPSGTCEPCHLTSLAQAHRDARATRDAQRDLWRARQRKVREGRT